MQRNDKLRLVIRGDYQCRLIFQAVDERYDKQLIYDMNLLLLLCIQLSFVIFIKERIAAKISTRGKLDRCSNVY
uniref:Uncharacterized protein n=1 Tax=Glossina palpalis gambiensis TaxID=67801 RepID=A0A1B0BTL7_9MUSC